jgi:hypothetical protein
LLNCFLRWGKTVAHQRHAEDRLQRLNRGSHQPLKSLI